MCVCVHICVRVTRYKYTHTGHVGIDVGLDVI